MPLGHPVEIGVDRLPRRGYLSRTSSLRSTPRGARESALVVALTSIVAGCLAALNLAAPIGGTPATNSPMRGGPGLSTAAPPDSTPSAGQATSSFPATEAAWTNVTTSAPVPPGRSWPSLAYDAADGYDVLFGGTNGGSSSLNDTWIYSNGSWEELHPTTAPSGRYGASFAYDANSSAAYVVLFGGAGATSLDNDTWEFVKGSWQELDPHRAPSPRFGAAMTYDPANGEVILFGGCGEETCFADTWDFSGGEWTNITPSNSPPELNGSGLVYDAAEGYAVLYGSDLVDDALFPETWTFSGGAWTNVTASAGGPSGRFASGSVAAEGGASPGVVLFGGKQLDGASLNDTWVFQKGTWTNVSPEDSPAARGFPGFVWDPSLGVDVLFGGIGTAFFDDTYTWNGTAWARAPAPTLPPARYAPSLAYDAASGTDVLFGGYAGVGSAALGDTWLFADGIWSAYSHPGAPGDRWGASMAYDAADQETVLFGGATGYGPLFNDTWIFRSGTWSEIQPLLSPSPRTLAAMTYDSTTGELVLFGGLGESGGLLSDTWVYKAGAWSNVTSSPSPPPLYAASLSDDAENGQVVLFGGCTTANCTATSSETWIFSGDTWKELTLSRSPSARAYSGMAYDPEAGYSILYGGAAPGGTLSDTWEFSNDSWYELGPSGSPGDLQSFGFTYDNRSGVFLLVGGTDHGEASGSTWEFVGGPAVRPPSPPPAWWATPIFFGLPLWSNSSFSVSALIGILGTLVGIATALLPRSKRGSQGGSSP